MSSPKLVQMCLCVRGGVCVCEYRGRYTAAGLVVTTFLSLTQRIENGKSKWECKERNGERCSPSDLSVCSPAVV